MRKAIGYILNGVLVTVPIAIVVFIIYKVLVWLSIPFVSLRESGLTAHEKELTHTEIDPIGILILLVSLFAIGFLWAKLISETVKDQLGKWLDRIPLYKSVKDLMNAFVGSKKGFNKPVLVKINKEQDIEVIGFVTDEDLTELGQESHGKVGVYFPMSYSFAGHLMIVPKANVRIIDKNSVDVMKYIVSGGIVELEGEESSANPK